MPSLEFCVQSYNLSHVSSELCCLIEKLQKHVLQQNVLQTSEGFSSLFPGNSLVGRVSEQVKKVDLGGSLLYPTDEFSFPFFLLI